MMLLSAGVVPFMNAVGGSLYTCQKQEATIPAPVLERSLVPTSATHIARGNIYSDPHAL